ncbi:MAG: 4Fe-4S ferredoxin [Clostridia bacterium]|nr:4Fe-4S ferredoxin [Clostridia bacterium]
MHAVRNIKLCTKDCLCLYVCPTGATDTEDGQIDAQKCLSGCRLCVDACPSHAISLVPEEFPAPQKKTEATVEMLVKLMKSKSEQEKIAKSVAEKTDDPILAQLANALSASNRIMAEDLIREAGFLLPQGSSVRELLEQLKMEPNAPIELIERLLELL